MVDGSLAIFSNYLLLRLSRPFVVADCIEARYHLGVEVGDVVDGSLAIFSNYLLLRLSRPFVVADCI